MKTINHQDKFVSNNDLILASVIPPDEPINGYKQNDLGDIWWQTFFSIPEDQNPAQYDDISDPNGAAGSSDKASLTRIDSIQFLAGAVAVEQTDPDKPPFEATAKRTIKVPGGSVFFLPILNAVNPDVLLDTNGKPIRNSDGTLAGAIGSAGRTEEGARQELDSQLGNRDLITDLSASIDGISISNLFDYRQKSEKPFSYNLPENNTSNIPVNPPGETFGGVVADGYWVGIGNLSPENHVITFSTALELDPGNDGPEFKLNITYNISFDLNERNGTNRRDFITGTDGWDEIQGLNGNDYIVGGRGNDALYGGRGSDTLIGVNPNFLNFLNPGRGEIDILNGGNGRDTFVLGDANNVYYKGKEGKGLQDYAIIKDFNTQDTIQLHGNRCSYELSETYSLGGKSGTSIFLKDTHELIGFVEGVTNLSLASNDFSFVCY